MYLPVLLSFTPTSTPTPIYKGTTQKEKNLRPMRANSFLFVQTPFRKESNQF